MFNSLFILIGTFIGAGFASGKEIFSFFTINGLSGIISIFIINFLMFFIFYKILNIRFKYNLDNYSNFLELLNSRHTLFNNRIFLFIINVFLAATFYIMLVALCTLFNFQFGISKKIINLIIIFLCYNIFNKNNLNFIYFFNNLLMPFLIVSLIYISINNINLNLINFNYDISLIKAIISGLLYFSYNSLIIIPILFKIKIKSKKNNLFLSFLFTFIIFILSNLINLLLLSNYNFIKDIDLPILAICKNKNDFYSYTYFFIILSAILSTLFSSGFSFITNINKKNKRTTLIIFLSFSFVFEFISFSNLINTLYPFFGLLGLVQIFNVLFF